MLLAVFVPVALCRDSSGELYRQFAVTLSTAVTLSSLVALTLTPALCAMLLRPRPAQPAAFSVVQPGAGGHAWRLHPHRDYLHLRPWWALLATAGAAVVWRQLYVDA